MIRQPWYHASIMRRAFEHSLLGYREIARKTEQAKRGKEELDAEKMAHVVEFRLAQEAERHKTDIDTQQTILRLQERKQAIMEELHDWLKAIDRGEQQEVGERSRFVEMEDGVLFCGAGDQRTKITLGELLTDKEWGIEYVLDAASVPRNIQKRYAVERAKLVLRRLLNEQIAWNEAHREDTPELREAYLGSVNPEEEEQTGKIAERGVRTFLKKLVIDHGLPIEIVEADVHQDVAHKIDFAVRSTKGGRGVEVEETDRVTLGFQFTTLDPAKNKSRRMLEHKRQQIAKSKEEHREFLDVDDILLVAVPSSAYKGSFGIWKTSGKRPGGPDKFWPAEMRREILRYVMVNFMEPEEVETFAARIVDEPIVDETVAEHAQAAGEKKKKKRRTFVALGLPMTPAEALTLSQEFGTDQFRVAPQLLYALAEVGVERGVDLQWALQNSLAALPKKRGWARTALNALNNVLHEAGLAPIDPSKPETFPSGLRDHLRRIRSIARIQREVWVAEKLFPPRDKPPRVAGGSVGAQAA